jgi:hypothetical protein
MCTIRHIAEERRSVMTTTLRQIVTALTAFLALLGAARAALTTGFAEPLAAARGHACTHHALACTPK